MVLVDEGDPHSDFSHLNAPYIKLYTASTPNGQKVSILLELLNLKYHTRTIDLTSNEQKEDWFLKLNPNGRIPVLTYANSKGKKVSIMESASIMLFLIDKFDKKNQFSFKYNSKNYIEMVEWIFFQMSHIGPIQGQICHFKFSLSMKKIIKNKEKDKDGGEGGDNSNDNDNDDDNDSNDTDTSSNSSDDSDDGGKITETQLELILNEYDKEIKNCYQILENQLIKTNSGFLVGNHLSIADLIHFPWIYECFCINIDLQTDPHLNSWLNKLSAIPQIQKGMAIP